MRRAGQLRGVGLSAVRWDPAVGGVAALLAVEGARLLAAHAATDGVTTPAVASDGAATEEAGASARLTLALGESPLAVRPAAARAAWREDG